MMFRWQAEKLVYRHDNVVALFQLRSCLNGRKPTIRYGALLVEHARKAYMLSYLYVDDMPLRKFVVETRRWMVWNEGLMSKLT